MAEADPNFAVLMGDLFGPGMREASQKPVREVMSPIKVTVHGQDPIAKAIFLMIQNNVGLLPVIQNSKVAGIVRGSDLFIEITHLVLDD
jgi:CBS domain-containing protein